MVRVGILGASGYGGGELLRLLALHPDARVVFATSATYAGQPVAASFPGLAGSLPLSFVSEAGPDELEGCDLVFMARDNGVAMKEARAIVERGCRLIDLSADFRFRDTSVYDRWYSGPHADPELAAEAVYGLPELHRDEIRRARIVGNPGCYTTASILALAPLLAQKPQLVRLASLIVDAKSGVSGAGRSRFGPGTHFSEINESVSAYKVAGTHRHTPEIEQELSAIAGEEVQVTFTPHLIPMTRGIMATCYADMFRPVSTPEIREMYRSFYAGEPFVRIRDDLPATKHTLGSNWIHIGMDVDARVNRLTVVACLDNLGKGMAGQAIQNMNIMFGMEETAGLTSPALWP